MCKDLQYIVRSNVVDKTFMYVVRRAVFQDIFCESKIEGVVNELVPSQSLRVAKLGR